MNRRPGRRQAARHFALLGATTLLLATTAKLGAEEKSVEIRRTTYGIAHISAADYEGLGYGVAYAHAQDNVCQTAAQLVTARGERSKFFGAAAPGPLGLRVLPNMQIDLFVRAHMDDTALDRARGTTSAEAQALARGYVAGYNRYLADTGIPNLPPPCKAAAWVRPMTAADLMRLGELSMIQAGAGAFADAVLGAQPPAAKKTDLTPAPTTDEALSALAAFRVMETSGIGSNGWAFGKEVTPNGRGLLLGNPHFPWEGVNRFWQMHLTIPGKLDVMGASIGHTGVVQIGFNKDIAWTHTVSTGKRFTIYELTLDPEDPTAYLVDGQAKKMEPVTVEIEALGADGKIETKRHRVWKTQWGPMMVVPRAGLTWNNKTAYAIKDANSLNVRNADAWLGINRATRVEEIRAAISNLGIPWVNTIAADRHGSAMYADISVVPNITAEDLQRCASTKPSPALFAAGFAILDGSKSACDWTRDNVSAVPGLMPAGRMPVVVRTDWVQNSNDSYWLSHPDVKLTGISPMVGPTNVPQRLRTRIGIEEIRARLAGTDGLSGTKMGLAEVQSVLFRDRNLAGHLVLDDLLAGCVHAPADVKEGCEALRGWDRTSGLDAKGAPLFREFWRRAKDIANVWRVPFNPADPVATPAGLKLDNEDVRGKVFAAMAEAAALVKKAGFKLDATLGEVQVKATARGPVALHGGDEFEGVLNKLETKAVNTLTDKGYNVDYGSSYIQTVTFDERGPDAQGLLTYGQSSNPASPHNFDQLPRFSRKEWPKLPFHAGDIEASLIAPPLRLTR